MRLSENFTLEEFLFSQTATRLGIDMTPPAHVKENLQRLCGVVLQPIRDAIGVPIVVTSGYRPEELNTAIGGSKTSAHVDGRAADIRALHFTPKQLANVISGMNFPYDQLILEFDSWVHIGISKEHLVPRGEILTAKRNSDGKTQYLRDLV